MSSIRFALLALLYFIATGVPTPVASATPFSAPHRVYDSAHKRFIDFETLASRLAASDIVFLGEQHDNSPTHHIEFAILEGVARHRMSVILSLEMFERDVQPVVDQYMSGVISEAEFLTNSRPWKNYATDYRPLVELAKTEKWQPMLASNIPRHLAAAVARSGIMALDAVTPDERKLAAVDIVCPHDAYFRRFAEAMRDMGVSNSAHTMHNSQILYLYQAQCVRDETMAESLARAWSPGRLIIHVNGAFHSDFGLGTVARTKKRASQACVRVVSILPVRSLDGLRPSKEDRKRADYLLYVLKSDVPTP